MKRPKSATWKQASNMYTNNNKSTFPSSNPNDNPQNQNTFGDSRILQKNQDLTEVIFSLFRLRRNSFFRRC